MNLAGQDSKHLHVLTQIAENVLLSFLIFENNGLTQILFCTDSDWFSQLAKCHFLNQLCSALYSPCKPPAEQRKPIPLIFYRV